MKIKQAKRLLTIAPMMIGAWTANASAETPATPARQPLVDRAGRPAPGNVGQAGRPNYTVVATATRKPNRVISQRQARATRNAKPLLSPVTATPATQSLQQVATPLRAASGEAMPGNCMGKCGGR
jgi:hypothetical protein